MEGRDAVMIFGLGSTNFVSKTIAEFVNRISSIGNVQKRLSKLEEYVGCLEEEMRKIHAFKRELPLCMFLLSDAIVYLKEQSRKWCKRGSGELEKPVPHVIDLLKDDEEDSRMESVVSSGEDSGDKKSWTRSFQLWNSELSPVSESTMSVKHQKVEGSIKSKMGELFQTSESEGKTLGSLKVSSSLPVVGVTLEDKKMPLLVPQLSLVPSADSGSTDLWSSFSGMVDHSGTAASPQVKPRNEMLMPQQQQQQQSCRKQRRCWSPELHKTFVSALKQLGGPQVATPKQIRDLMRVDGLTNDEVKSHLQKYRIHTRRVSPNKQMDDYASQSTAVLGISWNDQDHTDESSKHNKEVESGTPSGPLELCAHPQGNVENSRSYV